MVQTGRGAGFAQEPLPGIRVVEGVRCEELSATVRWRVVSSAL
jgi:hypothetical protein